MGMGIYLIYLKTAALVASLTFMTRNHIPKRPSFLICPNCGPQMTPACGFPHLGDLLASSLHSAEWLSEDVRGVLYLFLRGAASAADLLESFLWVKDCRLVDLV